MLRRSFIIEALTGALVVTASVAACAGADRRQALLDSLSRDSEATAVIAANTARAAADSARLAADSSALHAPPPPTERPLPRSRPLDATERAIADYAVFAPRTQQWFLAAVRARRLLVDVGRYDGKVGSDGPWHRALANVARAESPLDTGSLFRVRGPWGVDTVSVSGFDVYHGRLVATLAVPPSLDSIVRRHDGAGTAERIEPPAPTPADSTTPSIAVAPSGSPAAAPAAPPQATPTRPTSAPATVTPATPAAGSAPPADSGATCTHDTLPTPYAERVALVRDSIVRWITDSVVVPLPRLAKANRIQGWMSAGCFGAARAMVLVSRRNETGELAVDRALLVGPNGELTRLRILDLRFHAHDPLFVADIDGDGVDDLVTRGYGSYSGATTALRLDPGARTLKRVAAGFAWESR